MNPITYLISGCSSGSTTAYTTTDIAELIVGEVYALIFTDGIPSGCFTVLSEYTSEGEVSSTNIKTSILQTGCNDCETFIESPINSGSYTYVWCDSCDNGSTKTEESVSHPIAISQDGFKEIIQITSVTIGGPNGLNN